MKRFIFISAIIGAISATDSWGVANCYYAEGIGHSIPGVTKAQIEAVPYLEDSAFLQGNCATYDTVTTIYFWYDDGTYRRIDSCASCSSGYHLKTNETGWYAGDFCYDPDNEAINASMEALPLDQEVCVADTNVCTYYQYGTYPNCYPCPSYTDENGKTFQGETDEGDQATITRCYIPTTIVFGDSTGDYNFPSKCRYTS